VVDKYEKCAKTNLKLLKTGFHAKINHFFLPPVVSVRWMFCDRFARQTMNCGGFHHNLRLCAVAQQVLELELELEFALGHPLE
jgi:hypothetical protein